MSVIYDRTIAIVPALDQLQAEIDLAILPAIADYLTFSMGKTQPPPWPLVIATDVALDPTQEAAMDAVIASYGGDKSILTAIATQEDRTNGQFGVLLSIIEWATDNGNGTYSDKVKEVAYEYNSNNSKLISKTTTEYYADGTVRSQVQTGYFVSANGSVVEKEIP